jgi:CelD/BcsL family acetyltransferase involved in cellulose biosynthesis
MLSIRPVTTLEEFETLAQGWNALLAQTDADIIFLTWQWQYTWAKHYLGQDRLWIILVHNGRGQLVGIAPFYIRRTKAYGVVTVRDLRLLASEGVGSVYLDIIASKKHRRAVLDRIYRYLHEEAGEIWDLVTLSEIPSGSSTIDLWERLVQEAGKVIDVVGTTACPLIDLPAHSEALLDRVGPQARQTIRRKRRRLELAGRVEYERVATIEGLGAALTTFVQLHQTRWTQKGLGGAFANPRFLAFHQEIVKAFGELGWVRFDFLRLDDDPVAGIYGFSYKERYSFYLPGFDPAVLPQSSPGILLLLRCAEEAIGEGHREFDLLRGVVDYKMLWATGLTRCLSLRHYNRHLRTTTLKLLESGRDLVKVAVR